MGKVYTEKELLSIRENLKKHLGLIIFLLVI